MDKAALVTADLVVGSRILEILDGTGVRLSMAMWLRTPEYEDWRFARFPLAIWTVLSRRRHMDWCTTLWTKKVSRSKVRRRF